MENRGKGARKGAVKHCAHGNCHSDSRYNEKAAFFFVRFPKTCLNYRKGFVSEKFEKHVKACEKCGKCARWVKLCNRKNFTPKRVTKDTYICSLHFVGGEGPSESNPDPISPEENSVTNPYKRKFMSTEKSSLDTKYNARKRRIIDQTKDSVDTPDTSRFHYGEFEFVCVADDASQNETDSDVSPLTFSPKNESLLKTFADASTQEESLLECDTADATTQTEHSIHVETTENTETMDIKSLSSFSQTRTTVFKRFNQYKRQNARYAAKLKNQKTSSIKTFTDSLKKNPKKCYFYTGLHFQQISSIMSLLGPSLENLKYWNSHKEKAEIPKRGKKSKLEELILVLVRLRRGLSVTELTYRFNISVSQVTNLTITWVQLLYVEFNKVLRPHMFPSRQVISENLPKTFEKMKNVRVLIDCTEFFCEAPQNYELQGNLYSRYKSKCTFKVLIGCTPNGCISFVSDVYEGSISDVEIFERSRIIDLLEPGDMVLADRGFTVQDILEERGVALNVFPFLNGRETLTAEEEIQRKEIAANRIVVQHAVGKVKRFRLLNKALPLNMRGIMSQVIFVCACLVKFQPPIISE